MVLDQVRQNLKNVIFSVLAAVRLQTALVAVNVVLVSVGEAPPPSMLTSPFCHRPELLH